jgi:flagellar basal body-associated protein FliL
MTGNPLIDKVLMGLNGAVVLLAAGLVVYSHTSVKPPPTDQAGEEKALQDGANTEAQITALSFKKQVVNLHNDGTRLRFLEVEMGVLPFEEAAKETIKTHEYVFQNALIEVAGGMTPDEVGSVTGKILLESRVKKAVNEKLGQPLVRHIYFGRFVVQ